MVTKTARTRALLAWLGLADGPGAPAPPAPPDPRDQQAVLLALLQTAVARATPPGAAPCLRDATGARWALDSAMAPLLVQELAQPVTGARLPPRAARVLCRLAAILWHPEAP